MYENTTFILNLRDSRVWKLKLTSDGTLLRYTCYKWHFAGLAIKIWKICKCEIRNIFELIYVVQVEIQVYIAFQSIWVCGQKSSVKRW